MKTITTTLLMLLFLSGCETTNPYPNYATAPMRAIAVITDVGFSEDVIDEGDQNIDAYDINEWKATSAASLKAAKDKLMTKGYTVSDTFSTAGVAYNALGKAVMQGYFDQDQIEVYLPEKLTNFKPQLAALMSELSRDKKSL